MPQTNSKVSDTRQEGEETQRHSFWPSHITMHPLSFLPSEKKKELSDERGQLQLGRCVRSAYNNKTAVPFQKRSNSSVSSVRRKLHLHAR